MGPICGDLGKYRYWKEDLENIYVAKISYRYWIQTRQDGDTDDDEQANDDVWMGGDALVGHWVLSIQWVRCIGGTFPNWEISQLRDALVGQVRRDFPIAGKISRPPGRSKSGIDRAISSILLMMMITAIQLHWQLWEAIRCHERRKKYFLNLNLN